MTPYFCPPPLLPLQIPLKPTTGLSDAEVQKRREKFGWNELPEKEVRWEKQPCPRFFYAEQ